MASNSKKKSAEKAREREQQESLLVAQKAAEFYRKKQEESGRPVDPREPVKRTIDNNWVHVTCALFTPEVKFGNAKALAPVEGIPSIPRTKLETECSECHITGVATVGCHTCHAQG